MTHLFRHQAITPIKPAGEPTQVVVTNNEMAVTAAQQVPPLAISPFDAPQAQAHQVAWARHLGVPVEYTNSIGMRFRLIPPGEFLMGTTPAERERVIALANANDVTGHELERLAREGVPHLVRLTRPYRIGSHEVTRGQFRKFVEATGHKTTAEQNGQGGWAHHSGKWVKRPEHIWSTPGEWEAHDDEPVVHVTWDDAHAFCEWLSGLEGREYTLPTEAQWEFACRAGSTDPYCPEGYAALGDYAWTTQRLAADPKHPMQVGLKKANPFGLYDMPGNVWEFCSDWYSGGAVRPEPVIDPKGPPAGEVRIVRGGAWYRSGAVFARSSCRQGNNGNLCDAGAGFRICLVGDLESSAGTQNSLPTFKNTLGMEFVLVPKGKSWLGGGKDKLGDKEVEIPADFYLGKYEVTQEEWEKVMGENPSHFSRAGGGKDAVKDIPDADLMRFPVESVSWDQCQTFVEKLNLRDKEAGWVYRLPTELEWEYACRGGPMSNKADSAFDFYFARPTNVLLVVQANFGRDKGLNRTCQVGTDEPNALGLFDIHGNVWEWCQDRLEATDRASLRVSRGGAWDCDAGGCGARVRNTGPTSGGTPLGLRLARVPSGAPAREMKSPLVVTQLTDADVQRIAALPAAEQVEELRKELMLLNSKFNGQVAPKIENDVVTEFSVNTDEIENIAPLRALKKLIYLDLRGTYPNKGKLSDLSPLKGMTFRRLDCSSTQVADLSPLADVPLTVLHVNHNPVSDLSPLTKMPLESLGIAETKVSDLTPLTGMKIKVLGAQLLPVTDLSPLEGMPLTGLDLYHTVGVTSLEPLRGMPLDALNLQDVPVSDLSPLQGMTTLRTLVLQATNVSDLSSLSGLKLTSLFLLGKQITDLSPLKEMPLVRLHIYGSGVSDLSPLKGMPLQEFRFDPQNITQGLDVLREIKTLQTIGTGGNQAWPPAEFWERLDKGEFK
jgi:formylglycine-generating enzyme required for sulfatase activity/Leucine-rich repeat (LRR) protein